MKIKKTLSILFLSIFILSCSSSDDSIVEPELPTVIETPPVETNPIIINNITSSKELAFTDETITLNIDASGYSNLDVTSTSSNVSITKTSDTTYNVNTTDAEDIIIQLAFSFNDFIETETINLSFFKHGVIDYNIVEGIEIDVDTSDKIISLLGEPSLTESNNSGTAMRWHYFDLGMRFEVLTDTNVVNEVRLYGREFDRTANGISNTSGIYQYEIGESLKISNSQLTTDVVLNTFEFDNEKGTESADNNLFFINYPRIGVIFFYFAEDINQYSGQTIPYLTVY